jgi:hypothetical protein
MNFQTTIQVTSATSGPTASSVSAISTERPKNLTAASRGKAGKGGKILTKTSDERQLSKQPKDTLGPR